MSICVSVIRHIVFKSSMSFSLIMPYTIICIMIVDLMQHKYFNHLVIFLTVNICIFSHRKMTFSTHSVQVSQYFSYLNNLKFIILSTFSCVNSKVLDNSVLLANFLLQCTICLFSKSITGTIGKAAHIFLSISVACKTSVNSFDLPLNSFHIVFLWSNFSHNLWYLWLNAK